MVFYFDTSALVKLVVIEPETGTLQDWLSSVPRHPVSSGLARTEMTRAIRRVVPQLMAVGREVLNSVTLLDVTTEILEEAGRLEPREMRTLDAIHLASALLLGDDLSGIVTYDVRLAGAARASGIPVHSPGADS